MTAIIQLKPEGRYSSKDIELLMSEVRDYMNGREIMHAKEAACFLGISERTLNRLIGSVPSHKIAGIGRVWLRNEILEFVAKAKS